MRKVFVAAMLAMGIINARAQVNDSNTPLHLMKPEYKVKYGVSTSDEIKTVMDRVLNYVSANTPATLEDKTTRKEVTNLKKANADTRLRSGDFRLTSYEWGVTYSAMLAATDATGDAAYREYAVSRMSFLAELLPYFKKIHATGKKYDELIRKVVDPHALDDAGAICSAMIKAQMANPKLQLRDAIDNYSSFILNKQYRLPDGTLARLRPYRNAIWLDDMFMGIPTIAQMGKLTNNPKYYDEAVKQIQLFAKRMWVEEKLLFRHGWVEEMQEHPAFHWGRANGWAILTLCEVLDVLPETHSGRGEVLELLQKHLRGLARLQQKDGFWHQLLDQNDTYLETSATAIYAYCFAHAINKGWIDARVYGPIAQQAWHAVESKVNAKGQVEDVCVGTGMGFDAAFYAYRPVHVMAAHGYGPVIWAGAEMIKMLKSQHPKLNDSATLFYKEAINSNDAIITFDKEGKY